MRVIDLATAKRIISEGVSLEIRDGYVWCTVTGQIFAKLV